MAETKVCRTCSVEKALEEFYRNSGGKKKGHHLDCIECLKAKLKLKKDARSESFTGPASSKVCRRCGIEKSSSNFYIVRSRSDGLSSYCRPCQVENSNENRPNRDPVKVAEQVREYYLQNTYGISQNAYEKLLEEQNGSCLICFKHYSDSPHGRLYVDHNHALGEVRGLLCHGCNAGLGAFLDNPDVILMAISYVEKHEYQPQCADS